jgi:Cysteine-rich secretory protein family
MSFLFIGLMLAATPRAAQHQPTLAARQTRARAATRARPERKRVVVAVASAPPPAAAKSEVSGPSFEARLLEAHNLERTRMGQAPLTWSSKLTADALVWAQHLAQTATFEHADEKPGEEPQGENLWMGTKNAYSPEAMVGAWIEERAMFTRGAFPKISTTGNWIDVGHYSQLIWYSTTQLGCAHVPNRADDYLVCRYFPSGNWDGDNPLGHSGAQKQ